MRHVLLLAGLALTTVAALAQDRSNRSERVAKLSKLRNISVLELRLEGTPDAKMVAKLRRTLAESQGASVLVVRIDIVAPWSNEADTLTQWLEQARNQLLTIAFIQHRAFDAGAQIALAADYIALAPEAQIGAAPEVDIPLRDAIVLRRRFEQLAARSGHPVALARAFVDADAEIASFGEGANQQLASGEEIVQRLKVGQSVAEWVKRRGARLRLDSRAAVRWRLAEARPDQPAILFDHWNLDVATVHHIYDAWSDNLVATLAHPLLLALLVGLGVLGIKVELTSPGFGAPGLFGIGCLVTVLVTSHLSGATAIAELLLIALGVLLLLIELLVLPGFGLCGISGLVCLAIGVVLGLQTVLPPETTWEQGKLIEHLLALASAIAIAMVGSLVAVRCLPHLPLLHRLTLAHEERVEQGFVAGESLDHLRGRHGTTITALKPCGKIEIDGQPIDVVCEGEYVAAQCAVFVRDVKGNRIVVERLVRA